MFLLGTVKRVILQVPPFDTLANDQYNSNDILLKRMLFTDLKVRVFRKEKHSGIVLGEEVAIITNLIPMGVEADIPLTPAGGSSP